MPRLIEVALHALRSAEPKEFENGVSLAINFIELSLGQAHGLDRPEVLAEPATRDDVATLRAQLRDRVGPGSPPLFEGMAVVALGKLYDSTLEPLFIDVLRRHVATGGEGNVLYQAMIALDNLGVRVFAGRPAVGVLDEDENRQSAAAFLRQLESHGGPVS